MEWKYVTILVMRTLKWARIDLNPELLPFIWTRCSDHIYIPPSIIIIILIIIIIHIIICHHNHPHHALNHTLSSVIIIIPIMHLYHTDTKLTQPFGLLSMPVRMMMMMITILTIIVNIFIYHCHDQYSMNWWPGPTPTDWPSQISALIFTIIPLVH